MHIGATTRRCSGSFRAGPARQLRAESAQRTVALEFDGYGIGGLSVGETRGEMVPALAAALAHLPADRPRYLMGVGDPASLIEAVALGVDQFDCVMQTRIGRHGTALTSDGKLHIKNAKHALSDEPLDSRVLVRGVRAPQPRATSGTCSRWASRLHRGWSACTTSAGHCS